MTGTGTQTRTTGVTTIALLVLRTGELKIVSLCRVLCSSFFVPYYISFVYQDQWKNSYGESDQCLHCLLHTYFIIPPDVFLFFFSIFRILTGTCTELFFSHGIVF